MFSSKKCLFYFTIALSISPAVYPQVLDWQPAMKIAADSELQYGFNNAQPIYRSRDEQWAYVAFEKSDGLFFIAIKGGSIAHTTILSTNPEAHKPTIDEAPNHRLHIAYSVGNSLVVRYSEDQGEHFTPETPITGTGFFPAGPSLSFAEDGTGYLVWHDSKPFEVARYSIMNAVSGVWSVAADLDTGFEESAWAGVWAIGGTPIAVWRSVTAQKGGGDFWSVRFGEWDSGSWALSTLTPTTLSGYDPSVCHTPDGTLAAFFSLDAKIHYMNRPSGMPGFTIPDALSSYGRFPRIVANAQGLTAISYEHSDAFAIMDDNSVKEFGLALSLNSGEPYQEQVLPETLADRRQIIQPHIWLSDHWLDLIWVDQSIVPQEMYWQAARIVYLSGISDWSAF